ncbi:Methyl-accepting chemotaxis protein (MCP) signaling domain protein [anaerobic digester metagenome]
MKFLNNLSMAKKLIIFTIIAVAGLCIVGYIGISSLMQTTDTLNDMYDYNLQNIVKIDDLRANTILYSRTVVNHMAARNAEYRANWEKTMAEQDKDVQESLKQIMVRTDVGKETVVKIENEWNDYTTAVQGLVKLVNEGKMDEARDYRDKETLTRLDTVTATIEEYQKFIIELAETAKKNSDAQAANAFTAMILISLIVAVILIGFAVILTRSITGPLNRVVEMLNELTKGHLSIRLSLDQKDELGVMASTMDNYVEKLQKNLIGTLQKVAKGEKNIQLIPAADDQDEIAPAVNTMITTIESVVGEVNGLIADAQEGNLKTRGKPEQFVGSYREIIEGINNMLEAITTPLNEALRVADLFAHAKFGSRFDESVEVRGDLIALKEGLNTVGRELSLVIREVSDQVGALTASAEEAAASVEEVTAGAATLAQSSGLVSTNAESSVRSVEQVLNAMEDLSSSVATIATKVDAVSKLSQEANTLSTNGVNQAGVAEKGITAINESVNDVGSIIVEIRSQMNEIGKIVDIIGDIADQTNLLALNAAIEAARAGDAGMGFAVVANEVKTLAQESQGSAENIGQIIASLQQQSERAAKAMDQATTEVSKGSDAITETIQFFHTIADQVEDISQNMVEVASLSEEGAAAVEEITASISEVKNLSELTAQEAIGSSAASEEASAALNQISTVISDLSVIATRINSSMDRLNG